MKVIIPASERKDSSFPVIEEFRNADMVYIYDCENKTNALVPIRQVISDAGNLTLELKAKGIHTVISPKMSFFSLSLFLDSQFKVFKAQDLSLEENIRLFLRDELEPFNKYSAFGTGGCAPTACSSCRECD